MIYIFVKTDTRVCGNIVIQVTLHKKESLSYFSLGNEEFLISNYIAHSSHPIKKMWNQTKQKNQQDESCNAQTEFDHKKTVWKTNKKKIINFVRATKIYENLCYCCCGHCLVPHFTIKFCWRKKGKSPQCTPLISEFDHLLQA